MLNQKSFYVIDKDDVKGNIHVIGVGAMGSKIVEALVRLNLASKIVVYDMDTVEEKNLNNQAYLTCHIGKLKVDAIQNLSSMIDHDAQIRVKKKKVKSIRTKSSDTIFIAVDSFEARCSILNNIEGNPLVIAGGISSIGGNMEVVRGEDMYKKLASQYSSIEDTGEYDENDLTPCGSPISIYHRIQIISSFIVDRFILENENEKTIGYNIMVDIPNLIIIKDEI